MKKFSYLTLRMLPVAAAGLLVACASMGRPEGGPRDQTPPVYVKSNPAPGSLNVKNPKIVVEFDENVSIEDPMNKVVVSPAQRTPPSVSALGRHVTVELRDTMLENTTYTIDFADAIRDLNESNVLDGFAMDFATGDSIDSLRISGMVLKLALSNPPRECSWAYIPIFPTPPYPLCRSSALPRPISSASSPCATSSRATIIFSR